MIAPILLHFAQTVGTSPEAGTTSALWICFGLSIGGGAVALYLYVLGRVRLRAPDLETWLQGEEGAWGSPPLLAGIRHDSTDELLAPRDARGAYRPRPAA